jgi:glycosyltransferase involved in cell wall biosynthesis
MAVPAETAPPLRILVWYWGRAGAGPLYTLELLRSLAAQPGLKVAGSIAAGNALRAETEALDLPLDIVPTYDDRKSFALMTMQLPLIRRRFHHFLRERRFDLVLSTMNHLWTPLLVDGVAASGAAYVPVLHDAQPHPGEAQPLWRWRRQREVNAARHIITLSAAVADGVAHANRYPRHDISVIPYGIPDMAGAHHAPRRYPTAQPFRFLFFGRIMAYKGLTLLAEAYRLLRAQTRQPCELWIVGAGDLTPYQASLAGLPDCTIVNRWLSDAEITTHLNAADAVVLPYTEASQSGVTSQAYAAGLPVVVTPVGGLAEQVVPNQTGIIAAAATAEALAAAMLPMLDAQRYEQMGTAVATFRAKNSFAAQGPLYAALFRRVLAARRTA